MIGISNANNAKIYITDEGTSNGWHYRLWSNKTLELWKNSTITVTQWLAWDDGFESKQYFGVETFPFEFSEIPVESATLSGAAGNGGMLVSRSSNSLTTTTTAEYCVFRPNSGGSNVAYRLSRYIVGKKK